jgi:hypothetical protein
LKVEATTFVLPLALRDLFAQVRIAFAGVNMALGIFVLAAFVEIMVFGAWIAFEANRDPNGSRSQEF